MNFKTTLFFTAFLLLFLGANAQYEDDTIKIIKRVYVLNHEGAQAMETPNEYARSIDLYNYGDLLSVMDTLGEWLQVKRMHWVGSDPVYVKKSDTGLDEDILLDSNDLNYTNYNYSDNNNDGEPEPPEFTIKVESITKAEFDKRKKKEVNYFTPDTTIPKIGGSITLKTKGIPLVFVDNNVENETIVIHHYEGYIKPLDAYVMSAMHWEDYGWNLYNRGTGALMYSSGGLPMLSPDKKLLGTLTQNIYENTAEFSIDKVYKDSVVNGFYCAYKYWMPSGDVFWSKDNCLYAAIVPSITAWTMDGNENKNYRYVRLRITKTKK